MTNRGILFVVSGPAGVGKGTVCKEYVSKNKNAFLSVSATTRAPRPGEEEGINYFFKTREEFERMLENDEFIEHAEFCGNLYGTPKRAVEQRLEQGSDVILEIEVQGALQIKQKFSECVLIFIVPPSYGELETRLVGRGTETPEVVEKRLRRALEEFQLMSKYDYILMNDVVDDAEARLECIAAAERLKASRNTELIKELCLK